MNIRTKPKNVSVDPKGSTRFGKEIPVTPFSRYKKDEVKKYIQAEAENGKVSILVMDGKQSWYGGWFLAENELLMRSQKAVSSYRNDWEKEGLKKYPWIHKRSTATGLSQHFRGKLVARPREKDDDRAIGLAKEYLTNPDYVKYALMGTKGIQERMFVDEPKVTRSAPYRQSKYENLRGMEKERFHVEFQQYYRERGANNRVLPVYGAKLAIHMVESRLRTSVTSTYMPIRNELFSTSLISRRKAIAIAKKALIHYEVSNALLDKELESLGKKFIFSRAEKYIKWSARTKKYEGSPVFVYPYAGIYFLAYEVYLVSPDRLQTWRIFIDAEFGAVLGSPENLAHFAFYLKDSASAEELDTFDNINDPQGFRGYSETNDALSGNNPCRHFMDIQIGGSSRTSPDWNDDAKLSLATIETNENIQFVANNIAIHARDVESYFNNLQGGDFPKNPDCPSGNNRNCLSLTIDALETPDFVVHFNPDAREIFFQYDPSLRREGFLTDNNKPVYHPSWDPEVIYHEVVHALMWARNPDPFEFNIPSTPFARSIVEGYAIYFSRACAATMHESGEISPKWAKASYREQDWGNRWSLFRDDIEPGQDFLSIPNRYPGQEDSETWGAYDVGMVWARSLWDIRRLVGAEIGDRLVLEAYQYAKGWIHGFETVAEGLLDEPLKTLSISDNGTISSLLGSRGIMAEQGIQALLSHKVNSEEFLFLASDQGVLKIGEDGTITHIYDEGGVVDMAVGGGGLYIATETSVVRIGVEDDSNSWESMDADWPVGQRPFSLTFNADKTQLYMGGGNGIWQTDINNPSWRLYRPTDFCDSSGYLGFDIAVDRNGSLFAVSVEELRAYRLASGGCNSTNIFLEDGGEASLVSCVTAFKNTIFCGTDNAGIYVINEDGSEENIATKMDIGFSSVLCLVMIHNQLYAGTTKGIYYADLDDINFSSVPWVPISKTSSCIVTAIAAFGGSIYAATPHQGLWWGVEGNNDSWLRKEIPQIELFSGVDIPVLGLERDEFSYHGSETTVNLYPFDLMSQDKDFFDVVIKIDADLSAYAVELWSLKANIKLETSIESNEFSIDQLSVPARYAVVMRLIPGNVAAINEVTIRIKS